MRFLLLCLLFIAIIQARTIITGDVSEVCELSATLPGLRLASQQLLARLQVLRRL